MDDLSEIADPYLSLGIICLGRLSALQHLAKIVADEPGIRIVTTKFGAKRTLWITEKEGE